MRVVVATTQVPFVRGGAERHADGLVAALREHGHETDLVALPVTGGGPRDLLAQMAMASLVDFGRDEGRPVDRVIAMKFPAYLVSHPAKVVWLLHQHRQCYELWHTPDGGLDHHPDATLARDAVRAADREALGSATACFATSATVAGRLAACGVAADVLHPPLDDADRFRTAPGEPFLLFPSRLVPTKRQALAIRALAATRAPVRLVLTGTPDRVEYADELTRLAAEVGVDDRVDFLGYVSDAERIDLYARCRGVVFVPFDEDFGYVTLEAMLSSKPVVTCTDSGGPLEFVADGVTGVVSPPDVEALGAALDRVWAPEDAAAMGAAGRAAYDEIGLSWDRVVTTLLDAG